MFLNSVVWTCEPGTSSHDRHFHNSNLHLICHRHYGSKETYQKTFRTSLAWTQPIHHPGTSPVERGCVSYNQPAHRSLTLSLSRLTSLRVNSRVLARKKPGYAGPPETLYVVPTSYVRIAPWAMASSEMSSTPHIAATANEWYAQPQTLTLDNYRASVAQLQRHVCHTKTKSCFITRFIHDDHHSRTNDDAGSIGM
nr:hypothetical protein CFP56_62754 [Quercus suber]